MSDRFNTSAGWVLFAGIVALGLSSVSGRYFHADKPHRPHELGFAIEGVVEEGGEEGPSLNTLLATAEVTKGEKVFAKCTSCHTINQGGANGIGPNLFGVMGQPIGKHVAGYDYSPALAGHGGNWTFENMDAWLASPKGFAPGTKMSFAGLSNPEDRASLIVYMNTQGSNLPLPAADAAPVEEGTAGTGKEPGAGVEGAPVDPVEAVGAMGTPQPVPGKSESSPGH